MLTRYLKAGARTNSDMAALECCASPTTEQCVCSVLGAQPPAAQRKRGPLRTRYSGTCTGHQITRYFTLRPRVRAALPRRYFHDMFGRERRGHGILPICTQPASWRRRSGRGADSTMVQCISQTRDRHSQWIVWCSAGRRHAQRIRCAWTLLMDGENRCGVAGKGELHTSAAAMLGITTDTRCGGCRVGNPENVSRHLTRTDSRTD
jgi:hypothetical protein